MKLPNGFGTVYKLSGKRRNPYIVPSAQRTWASAFNHSAPLHNMRFKDIRANHLEETIMNADIGGCTKQRMKSLYNMMYKYALKYEIADKNYADLCETIKFVQ